MKKILSIACVALLPLMVGARALSPDEALSRVALGALKAPGASRFDVTSLAYTATDNGVPALYVFNAKVGDGYVVVSADDAITPVLGYSDTGIIDADNMPDNLRWWLGEYQRQIAYMQAQGHAAVNRAPSWRPAVEPLIKTKWNQSAPYNDLCPEINGDRCVTGCVATAMAQVMYYHQWPAQGKGSHTYHHDSLGDISLDFSSITYDWDAMTLTYSGSSSAAAKEAVAKLMYSCGVSVDMDYGVDGSGAMSYLMEKAFVEYFDYDKAVRYLSHNYFTASEWDDMVYDELFAGRPVLYDGQSGSGGHQFVCDGYADGYFHINWGWGGMSDGYFKLSALDPDSQGIGGSTSGYNYMQSILVGLQKPQSGSMHSLYFFTNGTLAPLDETCSRADTPGFFSLCSDGSYSYFFNGEDDTVNISYGVKLTDASGNVTYCKWTNDPISLDSYYGIGSYYVNMAAVANGTYMVTPAVYDADNDHWSDIMVPAAERRDLSVTLTDTDITFALADNTVSVDVTDFTLLTPVYAGRAFKVTATLKASKECLKELAVGLCKKGETTPIIWSKSQPMALKANTPTAFDYASSMYQYVEMPEVGTHYDMYIIDSDRKPVSDAIDVEYQVNPGSPSVSVKALAVANGSTAPKNDIRVEGSLTCVSGYLAQSMTLALLEDVGDGNYSFVASYTTPTLFANAGDTADFNMTITYADGTPGKQYLLAFIIGGSLSKPYVFFTMEDATPAATVPNQLVFTNEALTASTPVNTVARKADGTWGANKIVLIDGEQFYNPAPVAAAQIDYVRTFVHDSWAALYLPMQLTAAEWGDYASTVIRYTGDEVVDGVTVLTFETLDASATLDANYPYLMLPKADGVITLSVVDKTLCATPSSDTGVNPIGSRYALYGQYELKTDMHTTKAYALHDGAFYRASSDAVTLKPFRVYLLPNPTALAAAPESLSIQIGGTSGIGSVMGDDASQGVMYDLNGRVVTNPTPGIYILGSQKIMIK